MEEIPYYDEDLDESFTGPYNEEELNDQDETYDDSYEAETSAIFQDGATAPAPDGPASSCGTASGYTQLGAAPGSSNQQQGLPGHREFEPEDPTQGNTIEFASSEDDMRGL